MAKKVLREQIRVTDGEQTVFIGESRIVHVAQSRESASKLDIWFEIDADRKFTVDEAARYVRVFGTGHVVPDEYSYLGTCVCTNNLVWHIYSRV